MRCEIAQTFLRLRNGSDRTSAFSHPSDRPNERRPAPIPRSTTAFAHASRQVDSLTSVPVLVTVSPSTRSTEMSESMKLPMYSHFPSGLNTAPSGRPRTSTSPTFVTSCRRSSGRRRCHCGCKTSRTSRCSSRAANRGGEPAGRADRNALGAIADDDLVDQRGGITSMSMTTRCPRCRRNRPRAIVRGEGKPAVGRSRGFSAIRATRCRPHCLVPAGTFPAATAVRGAAHRPVDATPANGLRSASRRRGQQRAVDEAVVGGPVSAAATPPDRKGKVAAKRSRRLRSC